MECLKYKFGFVILHYLIPETTVKCVESIISHIDINEYKIIIVDNASPDASGEKLRQKYADNEKVSVILNRENKGYSAGNNIGIHYAKQLKCEFVVIMNNDTRILQSGFTRIILDEYCKSTFAVMGPRVIDPQGNEDSSPMKGASPLTLEEAKSWKRMWRKQYFKYILGLTNFHPFHRHTVPVEEKHMSECARKENVVLHGCCLIFSPVYLDKFDGLPEFSFMYLEEPALLHRLRENGMLSVFVPELKIFHEEAASTKKSKAKEIVRVKRMLEASKGLVRLYREGDFYENNKS